MSDIPTGHIAVLIITLVVLVIILGIVFTNSNAMQTMTSFLRGTLGWWT